ncbi:hypothetical protein EDB81DRAFT_814159 [Dactylonectria macrodidyma]|uniref:SnoaL-like domain-containing protein n=1 Tax=Dactylonectria macrodidyma TaxID=307937 RepID=A0A9P9IIQ2_9HYPO|nr:hypothetical protein EDB81DRAFT_814159 [Dactylonectria macrodidyma]
MRIESPSSLLTRFQLFEMASDKSLVTFDHLRQLYTEYRQTKDLDEKGLFFSEQCHQICRSDPSYAARERATIVQYLRESGPLVARILRDAGQLGADEAVGSNTKANYYTIRPLAAEEAHDFGTVEHVAPAGYKSVAELQSQAATEKWEGVMVDMWSDDGDGKGFMAKAKYWWRLEDVEDNGGTWRQTLHDILYLGVRDGTEGTDGGILIQDI